MNACIHACVAFVALSADADLFIFVILPGGRFSFRRLQARRWGSVSSASSRRPRTVRSNGRAGAREGQLSILPPT